MRRIALTLCILFFSFGAHAQGCTGNPPAGRLCGNNTGAATLPGWQTMSSMLDRNFGAPSTQGTILNRGASLWSATSSPILGANGGNSGAVVLNGSSTGSATIGVKAAAGSVTFNLPITNGSVNQVLITDGAGNTSWTTAGAGTVSSVGLALPSSILTVSGSPVTGAGTLTGTLATQTANLVWAGPTTGSAATPTFRSLVGADLPNPSASTLGGIESFAAVGSQWIRQISTSGVPTASQPAFTDVSGAISAAQCVLPTLSTVGCVQAINAVTSNWIRSISTSGVPALSQPNFTDLAGEASLGQLPSISSGSVLGNNSGGTAVPSPLTTSNILDFIATTQGDVLYRNGSIWTALPPGTNGQVLTSGGAAANPSWTTVTGTGTLTSVATNNGITGGTITTTGTIGLATITAGSVLANITGGSAVPIANTPSSILDLIGSATGDVLYRSSGGWTVLAPGTNGQVLTQGGTTPAWSNAGTLTNVTIAAGTGITPTGTCNITTTGTCTVGLSTARQTLPTKQVFLTGSGTYSTPSNTLWIELEIVGGGGGAGAGNQASAAASGGASCWNTTGAACSSPVYSAGPGVGASSSTAGSGGAISGTGACDWSVPGGPGTMGSDSILSTLPGTGGAGGNSSLGGAGGGAAGGAAAGSNAATNSGSGGGGGGQGNAAAGFAGAGGGSGATCHVNINTPAASFTYVVGAGGAGNASPGTGGGVGGNGAAGHIVVYEHYGS